MERCVEAQEATGLSCNASLVVEDASERSLFVPAESARARYDWNVHIIRNINKRDVLSNIQASTKYQVLGLPHLQPSRDLPTALKALHHYHGLGATARHSSSQHGLDESQSKACGEAQLETIGSVGGLQGVSRVQSISFQLLLVSDADLRMCYARWLDKPLKNHDAFRRNVLTVS